MLSYIIRLFEIIENLFTLDENLFNVYNLVSRIIRVSMETNKRVSGLPEYEA